MTDEIDRSPDVRRYGVVEPWPPRAKTSKLDVADAMVAYERSLRGDMPCLPLFPARPPIERYLRVSIEIPGGSIEAGLERATGEPLTILRNELRRILQDEALILNGDDVDDESAGRLIDSIEYQVRSTWSARAWFVEVWDAVEALSQVYQPYRK
jgi:hypothetical protein